MLEGLRLISDRFICNIAQPENTQAGLLLINRDPRKARIKPEIYVGVVEEKSEGCRLVSPGMKVVLRRWDYNQHNQDEERVIAREREILVMDIQKDDGSTITTPAPGVVMMQIVPEKKISQTVIVPDTVRKKQSGVFFGRVIKSAVWEDWGEEEIRIKEGMYLWVERRDVNQYFLKDDILIFRNSPDAMNGERPILMIGEADPSFNSEN